MPMFDNFIAFCSAGVFNLCGPFFQEELGMSQTDIGNTFVVSGVAYIFTTIAAGMVNIFWIGERAAA